MNKEIITALLTTVIYFIFYNLIIYTLSRDINLKLSAVSALIFFVVYYFLLAYLKRKKEPTIP